MISHDDERLTAKDYGKTFKLISVETSDEVAHLKDSEGANYEIKLTSGCLADLPPASDLETARKLFINKTLWLNEDHIRLGAPLNDDERRLITGLRLEPVTVTEIKLGWYNQYPFVFVLKTAKGDIGYLETNVSGTNTINKLDDLFGAKFFTRDPRLIYKFTPQVWANVKNKVTVIGMPKDAVRLNEGSPKKINTTITGKMVTEQWVYGSDGYSRYLYFTNDKLTSIQQ
jgi:hypothetical protein